MRSSRAWAVTGIGLLAAGALVANQGPAWEPGDPTDAERARWTMADLRSLGMAFEAYRGDNGALLRPLELEEALRLVEPSYMRKAPARDAWGTPFRFVVLTDEGGYAIVSAGADGIFDETSWRTLGEDDDFNADAVVYNGQLVRSWVYR